MVTFSIGDAAQEVVHEFDSSGAFVEDISGTETPGGSFKPQGLAVDSTGRLYVADASHPVVDVFGAGSSPLPKFPLTVTEIGSGTGIVTSKPAGINCEPTCEAEFEEGKTVTLEAEADAGSTFAGWSGGGCSGVGACEVTISEAMEVDC